VTLVQSEISSRRREVGKCAASSGVSRGEPSRLRRSNEVNVVRGSRVASLRFMPKSTVNCNSFKLRGNPSTELSWHILRERDLRVVGRCGNIASAIKSKI